MFNCCSLYSGSSGNSFLVSTDNTKILIDAGVSCKKIIEALDSLNVSINDITAILITHEHIDHTKGVPLISHKYNIPVYATKKTWDNFNHDKIDINNIKIFNAEESFTVGDITVFPFSTPHDAADPCGFKISYDNKTMCIATDLGFVSPTVFKHFESSSLVMLESNYDPEVLKFSSYPLKLKQRINSNIGHLSNISAGETISKLANFNLKNAILIHLSQENNVPELALTTIQEELTKNNVNLDSINIEVAPRCTPSRFFKIC